MKNGNDNAFQRCIREDREELAMKILEQKGFYLESFPCPFICVLLYTLTTVFPSTLRSQTKLLYRIFVNK